MNDKRCWFLAVDFDKASWQLDVSAFAETCKENSGINLITLKY